MRRKVLSASLMILLLGTTILGCSSGDSKTGEADKGTPSGSTEATTYPIQTDKTLTYWGEINGNLIGVKIRTAKFHSFKMAGKPACHSNSRHHRQVRSENPLT